jgi:hypothetical protein
MMSWKSVTRGRARSRVQGIAMGALSVLVPSILWAGGFSTPHTFASNTPALASQINDNFGAVETALNKTITFVHVSNTQNTPTNPVTNYTCIDNPATNGDPNATLFITRVLAGNYSTDFIPTTLGTFYDSTRMKWCIQRQDTSQMPINAGFNVLVVKS